MTPVPVAGSLVILISFAVRASFGIFRIPVAPEFGWPRTEFSLAIAVQNPAWGIGQPVFAERFGDRRAIVLGPVAIAVIGSALLAGRLGNLFPREYLLAGICTARAALAAAFIPMPITPVAVPIFSAVVPLPIREGRMPVPA